MASPPSNHFLVFIQGFLVDPKINGLHYAETTDGKFTLMRGTGRNESIHRRLNAMWPDRCGAALAAALLLVFFFNWTAKRCSRPFTTTNYTAGGSSGASLKHGLMNHQKNIQFN
jgi:hypothetical protein